MKIINFELKSNLKYKNNIIHYFSYTIKTELVDVIQKNYRLIIYNEDYMDTSKAFQQYLIDKEKQADKLKAKKGSFRISEKALFLLALSGGIVAEYFTMRLIRHKTLHKRFMIGLPVIILLQLIAVIFIITQTTAF